MKDRMKGPGGSEVVVMGVIATVALAVALVIGLSVTDSDPQHSASTPLISMLVAVVPLTITSLLALLRTSDTHKEAGETRKIAEQTKAVAEKTHRDLTNGVLTANMRAAIRAVATEDDVAINRRVEAETRHDTPPLGMRSTRVDPAEGNIPGAPGTPGADLH